MPSPPPRILRLTSSSSLITARAFEEAFTSGLAAYVEIAVRSATDVLDDVLGPVGRPRSDGEARARLKAQVAGADYLCVDYQTLHLLPLLASLRNRAGSSVRLLVIGHTPALYPVDWALLRLLLRSGDRIIAPTEAARSVVESLCPELGRWIRVVPHPVVGSPDTGGRRSGLVFLGRVVEGKVIHRVLDALALIGPLPASGTLDVVGPLGPAPGQTTPYVRSLLARRKRLGLDDTVRFRGPVEGSAKKGVLTGAAGLVNLSLTLEESFGKSVAEGLSNGVPAMATDWNGLPEVAGPCGITVPVTSRPLAMDVEPAVVAEGLERLLAQPASPEDCRESARRFHPDTVGPRYRDVLEEALAERDREGVSADEEPDPDEPAVPVTGLLAGAAPLTGYSWGQLYRSVVEESDRLRAALIGTPTGPLTEAGHVRTHLKYGLRRSLEQVFAGIEPAPAPLPDGAPSTRPSGNGFLDRVERGFDRATNLGTRVVCLQLLWSQGRHGAVRERLDFLRSVGVETPGTHYLEVEWLARQGCVTETLDLCLAPADPGWWDEHAAVRLCQLADVAIQAGLPDRALPRLRTWTEGHPDAPEAGSVWLARAHCAGLAGGVEECIAALGAARALLGEHAADGVLAALLGSAP